MRSLFGFLFIIIGFIGVTFFRRYYGELIPYPTLWLFLFLALGVTGVALLRSEIRGMMNLDKRIADKKFIAFKTKSERIQIDFDRCEFKNGSYSHEVVDENVNTLNVIAPGFRYTPMKTESVLNATLIYNHTETERFITSYPVDPITLKTYVLSNRIVLYVNPFDRKQYGFELIE